MEKYYTDNPELGPRSQEMKDIDNMTSRYAVDEFGASTNPMQHQTEALKARIFHGANRVEFSFFGRGKGSKEQSTPGSYGAREREDMRHLAEFNKVETSTHATVGVTGLSGLNMQQGSFDDRQRKEAIDEVKRAIHFAAEATTGGAVVFHSGEAPRYMYDRWKDDKGQSMFKAFPEEEQRRMTYLVDPISKKLVAQIQDIDRIAMPIYKTDEKGNIEYLKDENGNIIKDDLLKKYDTLHDGKIPQYETDEKGNIKTKVINYAQFKDMRRQEYEKEGKPVPTEEQLVKEFFQQQRLLDVQYNLHFGKGSEREYMEGLDRREKIIDTLNFYKKLKKNVPEDQWWKYKKTIPDGRHHLIPPDNVDPVEYLEKALQETDRRIIQAKEMAVHGRRQAEQVLEMVERSQLADKFALTQTEQSMAELGIYAWQMTNKAHKDYKDGKAPYDLKNPIYIAPENLFPEVYGSHPDELKEIILRGRQYMVKQLKDQYKMDEKKAKELAQKHIKATFDIGHANMWRKYFVSKEGESLEERDKRFNQWLIKKTKKLVDEGIIGHIHVNDNFGFHDEHLSAGDGNAPIKDFIENAKKAGLKEFIVESGSFNPLRSLPDTWMHFDSPVYHVSVPGITRDTWTDFYRSYFGRTEGPRYIVGEYAPSDEFKGSPFYSGLPLE